MPSTYRQTCVTVIAQRGTPLSIAGSICQCRLGTRKLEKCGSEKGCHFGPQRFLDGFAKSLGSVIRELPR